MNTTNPFQIPACFQINQEQRRRERFKKAVIMAVASGVILLIGLLIEGCKSERAAMTTPVNQLGEVPPAPAESPAAVVVADPKPAPISTSYDSTPHSPAVMPMANSTGLTGAATKLYVVKAGDTLSRIAKVNGTTVKAIETANGLVSDRILAGAKLIIPQA